MAAAGYGRQGLLELLAGLLQEEVKASRNLERIASGKDSVSLFRTNVVIGYPPPAFSHG